MPAQHHNSRRWKGLNYHNSRVDHVDHILLEPAHFEAHVEIPFRDALAKRRKAGLGPWAYDGPIPCWTIRTLNLVLKGDCDAQAQDQMDLTTIASLRE